MMKNKGSAIGEAALKAGVWYVTSSVMVKAISIITTPIFTHMMTTEEYGTVSTFTSWHTLLLTFFSLNLIYSVGRAKLDYPGKLDDYIGSMQLLSATVSAVFCVIILVFLKPISTFMELDESATALLMIYLFFGPTISFRQNGYRYKYQYKQNIAIAWYIAVSTVALSLVLMLGMNGDKAHLRMIGITIPTVALSGAFWIDSLKSKHVRFNREYWRYGWILSGPLILHTVSMNILSQSDRIFISKIWGTGMTGIYSLAYNYGLLLNTVTGAVSDGWLPWFHDNYFAQNFDKIQRNVKKIVVLGCFISLACIAMAPEAILILGGKKYADGIYCVPPIVLGIVCQYIYTHYVNIEMHLKKTKYVSYGTIFAAILNLILNAIFIPIYGFVTAAYTTLFSYLCLMFIHYFITKRILKVSLYKDIFMFGSLFITSVIAVLLVFSYSYSILRYIMILIGLIAFMWTFREYIMGYLKKSA